jgi:microcystin-dependent protein
MSDNQTIQNSNSTRRGFLGKFTAVLAGSAFLGGILNIFTSSSSKAKPSSAMLMSSQPYIGGIALFGGNFAVRDWAICDGTLLPIASYSALFSLLGTTYGGDGVTTFALPDLRGRAPIGVGTGAGLSSYTWGQTGGVENVTLSVSHMPSHQHHATLNSTSTTGNSDSPENTILAINSEGIKQYSTAPAPNVQANMASITMNTQGGGQAFSVRNPYLAMYYQIALTGIFPSRS